MIELPELLSVSEAAELSGRSPNGIRYAIGAGLLPAKLLKLGSRRVYVTTRQELVIYVSRMAVYRRGE